MVRERHPLILRIEAETCAAPGSTSHIKRILHSTAGD